jgi:hypothetical protein
MLSKKYMKQQSMDSQLYLLNSKRNARNCPSTPPMRVLAVNRSPMMDKGNTALIRAPVLTGTKEAGANARMSNSRSEVACVLS